MLDKFLDRASETVFFKENPLDILDLTPEHFVRLWMQVLSQQFPPFALSSVLRPFVESGRAPRFFRLCVDLFHTLFLRHVKRIVLAALRLVAKERKLRLLTLVQVSVDLALYGVRQGLQFFFKAKGQ